MVFWAVAPTVCFLLSVGFYAPVLRKTASELSSEFGITLPMLTEWMMHICANPFVTVGMAVLISLGLVVSLWKRSAVDTLCLAVACLSLAMFSSALLYLSFLMPLVSLMQNLAG